MSESALPQGAAVKESVERIVDRIGDRDLPRRLRRRRLRGVASAPPRQRPDKPAESSASAAGATSTIVDLPPIVTNLGAPQDTWVRLEGSIIFDPEDLAASRSRGGADWRRRPRLSRTVSLRQLEGPIGLENIRQDLNERAATRSGGKVRAFVIRTLVVQ